MVNLETLAAYLITKGPRPFALLSNQSLPTADFLHKRFPNEFKALFSPEHGFFGMEGPGEKTGNTWHPFFNIPVHSLYGEFRKPPPELLESIELMVIDLQDLGVRCYTYLATLKNTLEACAGCGIEVVVVDRPLPLGGTIDGPMRPDPKYSSFVAPVNVPLCHGMTPGEAAMWISRCEGLDVKLSVLRIENWSHSSRAPWSGFIPPSPAIRSIETAAMYPALVLTEAFPAVDCDRHGNLSFRVFGAPWLDPHKLLRELAAPLSVCGIGMRHYRYEPCGGRYANTRIDGILLSVERPEAFYPATAGVLVMAAILAHDQSRCTDGVRPEWIDKLCGTDSVRLALEKGEFSDLFQGWIEAQDEYFKTKVDLYSGGDSGIAVFER